jgi:MFS family permease
MFGLFGSMFFGGVVIGSFIFPRLSDIYGRKYIAIFGNLLHCMAALGMVFAGNFNFSLALIFIMGLGMSGRVFVGYVFFTDSFRADDVKRYSIAMHLVDSCPILVCVIYFKFVSKNWQYIYATPTIMLLLNTLYLAMQPEPPKFYHGIGDYKMAREVLTQIGRENRVLSAQERFSKKFDSEMIPQGEKSKLSVTAFLSSRLNLKNCLIFIMMNIACSFGFYLINFYVKYLPGSFYAN